MKDSNLMKRSSTVASRTPVKPKFDNRTMRKTASDKKLKQRKSNDALNKLIPEIEFPSINYNYITVEDVYFNKIYDPNKEHSSLERTANHIRFLSFKYKSIFEESDNKKLISVAEYLSKKNIV